MLASPRPTAASAAVAAACFARRAHSGSATAACPAERILVVALVSAAAETRACTYKGVRPGSHASVWLVGGAGVAGGCLGRAKPAAPEWRVAGGFARPRQQQLSAPAPEPHHHALCASASVVALPQSLRPPCGPHPPAPRPLSLLAALPLPAVAPSLARVEQPFRPSATRGPTSCRAGSADPVMEVAGSAGRTQQHRRPAQHNVGQSALPGRRKRNHAQLTTEFVPDAAPLTTPQPVETSAANMLGLGFIGSLWGTASRLVGSVGQE